MNENQKSSKIKRGISNSGSGENQVIVMQKNGVIRAARLKKGKSGSIKA